MGNPTLEGKSVKDTAPFRIYNALQQLVVLPCEGNHYHGKPSA